MVAVTVIKPKGRLYMSNGSEHKVTTTDIVVALIIAILLLGFAATPFWFIPQWIHRTLAVVSGIGGIMVGLMAIGSLLKKWS